MADSSSFSDAFKSLTGYGAMPWQVRLYNEWFSQGKFPSTIDLPTGLGKTMVMAIWLIARAHSPEKVPTRLIYVVDRRTVVDQATREAERLRSWVESPPNAKARLRLADDRSLPISTLRGYLADNRQWSRDPSRPAIIIGTVDLIGSALLFSGYRSSYKRRPLEAGLLGQDSLLVLDEAHLSKPFEKLLESVGEFQRDHGQPLQVVSMSATSATNSTTGVFRLAGDFDRQTIDFADKRIRDRYGAGKKLTIAPLGEKEKLTDRLAKEAVNQAQNTSLRGKRIAVFVRRPDDATKIADAIRKHGSTKSKPGPFVESVEVLTGTMRGLERDELVEKDVFTERWLNGDLKPDDAANQLPVFLISTSAGEVGFDLNADHMVCDATTIDSFIQRLGRVNRRGEGDATVVLVSAKNRKDKTDFEKACIAATKLLKDGMDLSPKNIAALKGGDWKDKYADACSPEPTTVELTDILLDAWSMTSITTPMPGRPAVGPWLRGIDEELPQTTIAWRAELDEPGFSDVGLDDIAEWFDTHRILTHETLSVPTTDAAKWFVDRWAKLDGWLQSAVGKRPIIVDRAGLQLVTVKEVVDQLTRKNMDSIRNAEIILPASFGGIERGKGLLDAESPTEPVDGKNADEQTLQDKAKARLVVPDVADIVHGWQRQRLIEETVDGEKQQPRIIGDGMAPKPKAAFRIGLLSDDDRIIRLVSLVPKREKLEYGSEKQTLQQHVSKVRAAVDGILCRLSLPDTIKQAAQLAADWHDHGKNRERWQRTIGGTATVGTTDWMQQTRLEGDGKHQCLGKSGGEMKRDSRGYRHEFGSLCEFADARKADVSDDVFDLAMHLIATHHGRGRPHFPKGAFDPDDQLRSEEIHTDAIRRFARLQKKYGRWRLAWLENLLRCADAMASAEQIAANSEGSDQ